MYIIAKCSPKNYLHYSVIYMCVGQQSRMETLALQSPAIEYGCWDVEGHLSGGNEPELVHEVVLPARYSRAPQCTAWALGPVF